MPRSAPTVYLYPLSNYTQGNKNALLEKDSSVKERMARMKELYKKLGMRRVVEGLLLVHMHCHPHVLLLQIGNTYFKLPGGRLRVGEHETDGLRRKLCNKVGCPNEDFTINWQIGELISCWWRPNFETVMYPYIPAHVSNPKECRKIFLTQLPPNGVLGVPKNLKLMAIPLFELYDNTREYGPVIASLPALLARVKFVFCDSNARPMSNAHIRAHSMRRISLKYNMNDSKTDGEIDDDEDENENAMNMNNDSINVDIKTGTNMNEKSENMPIMPSPHSQKLMPNSQMMFYPSVSHVSSTNLIPRIQPSVNLLHIPAVGRRRMPNARLIVTPTITSANNPYI